MESLEIVRRATEEANAREAERRRQQCSRPAGEERWYLAREARRFNEDDATDIFAEFDVDFYIPKIRKLVPVPLSKITLKQRRSGFRPREERLVPLLPGFVLLHLDFRRDDWRQLFDRTRLCGILGVQKGSRLLPQPIADKILEEFHQREELGAIPGSLSMRDLGYSLGETVRICDGHFSGYRGTVDELPDIPIESVDDDTKVRLLVMMFGRLAPVEISLSQIEKL